MKRTARAVATATGFALTCQWMLMASCRADDQILEPSLRGADRVISLPCAFRNETFGAAVGYVYAVNGFPQPQAGVIATVMAGTEGSALGFVMGQNIQFFGIERLFFDPIVFRWLFQECQRLHRWQS